MKSRKKNRILSLLLAMVMVIGVFVIPTPDEVSAATKSYSFKGTGKSSVTIKDADCYKGTSLKTHYIKYKAGVTGTITLKMTNKSGKSSYTAGYLTLCNSKKKVIGTANEYYDTYDDDSRYFTRTYGVKKGVTYYFRVKAYAGVKITATVKSVKDLKNHSKTKAKSLKAKSTVTGLIKANDKTADWYKITVPANKKVRITVTANTNGLVETSTAYKSSGGIKATLMNSKGKPWASSGGSFYASVVKKSNKCEYYRENIYGVKKGVSDTKTTFYIKVERLNAASSGSYTLKWQTY